MRYNACMMIYLSHAADDQLAARELAEQIRGHGLKVWSNEAIEAGENFALAAGNALNESNAMVVLVSPQSMRSIYVRHEIDHALTSPRFSHRVIPVVIQQTDDIPWILRKFQIIDAVHLGLAATAERIANSLAQTREVSGQ